MPPPTVAATDGSGRCTHQDPTHGAKQHQSECARAPARQQGAATYRSPPRALPPPPPCPADSTPTGCANGVFPAATGLEIDAGALDTTNHIPKVWFVGLSLGSINGVLDVAANPRITEAAFSVGGGSLIDTFTN